MANENNNFGRRRRTWPIIVVIAAVVLLAAFIRLGRKDVPVHVERVARAPIASLIATNGKIEPITSFQAHAMAPATVSRVFVQEGDRIRAGQLLLELDAAEARAEAAKADAQLRAAEADLHAVRTGGTHEEVLTTQSQVAKSRTEMEAAQRNLDALQRLQQKGAASAGEVQAAENRLKAAQADFRLAQSRQSGRYSSEEIKRVEAQARQARAAVSAAQDALKHSVIRSDRDGVVYSVPVRQGQFVDHGSLLVQVADLKSVQVRAFVDEPDIARLQPGQEVSVTWDAVSGRVWQGTLTRLPAAVVTSGTRNVGEIMCRVDNSDMRLIPNVNVSVNIITSSADHALTLPREAVHTDGGSQFVYEVVSGHLQRRDVKTAISNLTRIQITSGVSDNAEIAIGAVNNKPLQDGMAVQVANR